MASRVAVTAALALAGGCGTSIVIGATARTSGAGRGAVALACGGVTLLTRLAGHAFARIAGATGAVGAADVAGIFAVAIFTTIGTGAAVFTTDLASFTGHAEAGAEAAGGHTDTVITE